MYSPPPQQHRSSGRSPGLTRFSSAPGSFLSNIADSVINGFNNTNNSNSGASTSSNTNTINMDLSCSVASIPVSSRGFFVPPATIPESPCFDSRDDSYGGSSSGAVDHQHQQQYQQQQPSPPHPLIRHSSSPAGFFNHLRTDQGRRLKTEWSFSRDNSLSQISEISIHEMSDGINGVHGFEDAIGNVGHSYISSTLPKRSWDDSCSIAFGPGTNKRPTEDDSRVVSEFTHLDSQLSLPTTSMEIAAVEKFLQSQQDVTACRVRAKRGCATHPRSIAERERRTRISKKLKKLQDIVPNMDKQTNTADMLDIAVQHIKELKAQIQKLNEEREKCTCAIKKG